MRHRSIKSRAGRVLLGAVAAGALSGAGASIARATLTLDLEAGSGTPSSPDTTVSGATAGNSITLQVYAVVTDANNSGSADGLGGLFASFDAAGSAVTGVSATLADPNFDYALGSAASDGGSYTYTDTAGTVHHGVGNLVAGTTSPTPAYDSTTPSNWAFAAHLTNSAGSISSILTGGVAFDGGAYYNIGSLTLTTSASAANGSTATVTGTGRAQVSDNMVAALWQEGSTIVTPAVNPNAPAFTTDDSISIIFGTVGPTPHAGDTMPYDGHTVGLGDLTNVLNNYGTTNPAGYAWPDTAANDSSPVGLSDLTNVLNNYGLGNSPSIVLVPEPTSLCLLCIGALGLVGRRRK